MKNISSIFQKLIFLYLAVQFSVVCAAGIVIPTNYPACDKKINYKQWDKCVGSYQGNFLYSGLWLGGRLVNGFMDTKAGWERFGEFDSQGFVIRGIRTDGFLIEAGEFRSDELNGRGIRNNRGVLEEGIFSDGKLIESKVIEFDFLNDLKFEKNFKTFKRYSSNFKIFLEKNTDQPRQIATPTGGSGPANPNSENGRQQLAEERGRLEEERSQQQVAQQRQRLEEEKRQLELARAQVEKQLAEERRRLEQDRRQQQVAQERQRLDEEARHRNDVEKERQQLAERNQAASKPTQASDKNSKRKALLIGNDRYQSVPVLKNARTDAQAMGQALAKLGYKVWVKTDLNRKDMQAAIRQFRSEVQGGDEVVIFYAGHAVQIASANYLLPTDIAGASEDEVKDEAIQLQRLLEDMGERKTQITLALIDACRDNPFQKNGRNIGGRGLAPTTAATGQMIIFSAGAGQQALDRLSNDDRDPNGLFTRIFIQEMKNPGIRIDNLAREVRKKVVEAAKSVGHDQVPAIYDQVVGDFYFSQ